MISKGFHRFLLIFIVILSGTANQNLQAIERVEVYTFEQLNDWLTRQDDTLYVINFWATWCAPCVKEIPDFEKIHAQYHKDKVKVLYVSLDFPAQINSRVIPFINRLKMQGEVVLLDDPDSNRWIPQVSESWSGAIPATLIYGRGFREFYEKEMNYDELESLLLPLIN